MLLSGSRYKACDGRLDINFILAIARNQGDCSLIQRRYCHYILHTSRLANLEDVHTQKMTQLIQLAHSKPVVALSALVTHYVLHNGEWDNTFHVFLGLWTAAFGGLAAAEYMYDSQANSISAAVKVAAGASAVYFGVLFTSILLHRGFFHRLRKVSGRRLVDRQSYNILTLADSWTISGAFHKVLRCRHGCASKLPVLQEV
jgi:hypothetical protein